MKKLFLCLLAAAVVTACSKDDAADPAAPQGYPFSFGAGTTVLETETDGQTGPEVRAGYDGAKSIWHAGDDLGVTLNASNTNVHFTQDAGSLSADATTAIYSGTLNTPVMGNVNALAYFPYSASASAPATGMTVSTTFPATQTYVAGGYKGIPLFAAYSGDVAALKFQFKNVFSIVKLTLSKAVSVSATVNLQKIVFQGNNNETVSGGITVNMTNPTPTVNFTGSGKTITLDCGVGVTLSTTAQTFYIAVPAINYSSGYTLTFFTDQGQQTKVRAAAANYAANTVYKTTALALDKFNLVTAILDVNLQNALKALGLINIIDPLTGSIGINALGLAAVSIDVSNKGITSMVGIENFPLLTTLNVANNPLLTALDVTKLPLLVNLNVGGSGLTSLNLGSNPALLSLDVSSNALTSLDLSQNILLTSVKVYGNPLLTLNISGLKALTTLNLVSGVNSIGLLKLTIPPTANIQNIIANGTLLSSWTSFECIGNIYVKTISLQNNIGMLSVTANNNTALTSLNVTGSLQTALTVHTSGNASGFTVTGLGIL